ncbi:MAG: 2-methoxy-6-polyprenyl-1,4-benzoquinol methylase, mitochondrial [Chlamydiales bacterium]|nr:2-methoxy-6-polyprenyl-1,4-benzoquinol methylase, mitochondrial [Chlamydiales bacterium]MCH9619479.1 2-methoxy-6-polyprenyl-1,4-benzoquinol methylase, mitochondrial [Chlamydiales bacterium]MCH9622283.1 2-methoxy-6-polyprenyl-1,4-benzoquinol methylase, mitochondrial [Chlamydiales bacterium]
MGCEIDLLKNYPKVKRNLEKRSTCKTETDRAIARQFGEQFFDGERRHGYGGFSYHPRFWEPVIPAFIKQYGLTAQSKILDVGCAKGFMMHDFARALPSVEIKGVDISSYAIENAIPSMREQVQVADSRNLPFDDNSFDLVLSINTLHNLEGKDLEKGLLEIERVSRKDSFIVNDAYRSEEEKNLLEAWNLTARSIFHVDHWREIFDRVGYTGDYFWFVP